MKIMFNTFNELRIFGKKHESYGGLRNFNKNFINNFPARGNTFIGVLLVGDKTKDQVVEVKRKKNSNYELVKLSSFLRIRPILFAKKRIFPSKVFSTIKLIGEILAQENPDVLFLNGFSVACWYLMRAAALVGIPVVTVHHGLWFKEIKNFSNNITPDGIFLLNEMEKEICKYSSKEVFFNEFSLNEFQKVLKVKVNKKKLEIIPLPYRQLFEIQKSVKSQTRDFLKIGLVGRWDPIKNPLVLMILAKEAKKQKLKYQFYFVGQISKFKGLEEVGEEFRRWVNVVPPMKSEKLRDFYQEMDLMILPSNFDVSPTVVMEGILQNRMTLISKNVGWVSMYEKMGLTDWITDFGNPREVFKKIEKTTSFQPPEKVINYLKKNHCPKSVFQKFEKILKVVAKKV